MSDTLVTIIAIFLAATIMFIFPIMATANTQEEMIQTSVQKIVSDFANTVAQKGKITQSDYDDFMQKLGATGNTYDVSLEVQILDTNPGKKGTATSPDMIGENIYYSVYTTEITSKLKNEELYNLKKGDYFVVSVKNTNTTLATQFKNLVYKIVGKEISVIGASDSVLVVNTGR